MGKKTKETKSELKRFIKTAQGKTTDPDNILDANKFVPFRDFFDDNTNHGIDWNIENWGSKWNFANVIISKNISNFIVGYSFDSAWSPMLPVIRAMSEQFPTLIFKLKYYECGMGYKGIFKVQNGKVLMNKYSMNYRGHRGGFPPSKPNGWC